MNTCIICAREYNYDKKKGHNFEKCNSCVVNHRRFALKKKCVEYKGGKCFVCGYKRCIRALTFHHLDPSKKDFTISGAHCIKWSRMAEELNKCVLLCANCHSEIHDGLINLDGRENEIDNFKIAPVKGVKKTFVCKFCEGTFKETHKGQIFCSSKCSGEYTRKVHRPTKEILEDLIKTTSFRAIGKMYGVTDNSVRKWAVNYGLPVRKQRRSY